LGCSGYSGEQRLAVYQQRFRHHSPLVAESLNNRSRLNILNKIKPVVYILGLSGGLLFIFLLIREGAGQVGAAIARAGWGLLAITFYHLLQTLSDAAGWSVLIPKEHKIPLIKSFLLHWMGESINNLLPTGRVGGDIIMTRIAAFWGIPLRTSTAVMIVDITIGIVTKVIYIVTAFILLIAVTGRTDLARPAVVAVITGTLAAAGFYSVQRLGMFRWSAILASRLARSPGWDSLIQGGEALDQTVGDVYARRAGVAGCSFFWILSWFIASGEIWFALWALGSPSSFVTAVILESVALAIRGAAFLVPAAVGVQEGGYIVLGNLLGIPGEIALALSLIRRMRELALGIPGLIGWQLIEANRLWRDRPAWKSNEPSRL
jgi:putative membrane protein